jgi:hypothetical protein
MKIQGTAVSAAVYGPVYLASPVKGTLSGPIDSENRQSGGDALRSVVIVPSSEF